jgi:hypothetical protein
MNEHFMTPSNNKPVRVLPHGSICPTAYPKHLVTFVSSTLAKNVKVPLAPCDLSHMSSLIVHSPHRRQTPHGHPSAV